MKPSGCAAQTVIHMGETGRLQVRQEKLLFKVVQMGKSTQTWSRNAVEMKRGSFINSSAIRCLWDSGNSTSVTSQHHQLIFSSPPPLYEMSFI